MQLKVEIILHSIVMIMMMMMIGMQIYDSFIIHIKLLICHHHHHRKQFKIKCAKVVISDVNDSPPVLVEVSTLYKPFVFLFNSGALYL